LDFGGDVVFVVVFFALISDGVVEGDDFVSASRSTDARLEADARIRETLNG
jgi:hypothetical protein